MRCGRAGVVGNSWGFYETIGKYGKTIGKLSENMGKSAFSWEYHGNIMTMNRYYEYIMII